MSLKRIVQGERTPLSEAEVRELQRAREERSRRMQESIWNPALIRQLVDEGRPLPRDARQYVEDYKEIVLLDGMIPSHPMERASINGAPAETVIFSGYPGKRNT